MKPTKTTREVVLALLQNPNIKAVASKFRLPHTTVSDIKQRYIELIPVLKKKAPDPDQLELRL
jgi:hypothetical protein